MLLREPGVFLNIINNARYALNQKHPRAHPKKNLIIHATEEQIEEEATSSKITDELAMVGEDKSGLLLLDRELGGRAYPAGSPLDPVPGAE